MPIYKFLGPDKKIHLLEGPDPQAAQAHFESLIKTSPEMFAEPGVRAAMKVKTDDAALLPKRTAMDNAQERMTSGATLGLSEQEGPLIDAAMTGARNMLPFGTKPGYSARDAYDAGRLLQAKQRQQFQADHPVVSGGSELLGGLAMPGGEAISKFILGKAAPALAAAGKAIPMGTRAAQVARAAPVVAGLGATQGALAAAPGQEGADAARAAAGSLAAAPLAWAGTAGVSRAAPTVGAALSKLGNSDIATAGMSKLAAALRSAKLSPQDLQSALDNAKGAGGTTPALIDILQKAGAGPKVMRLVQTAGASPAAIRTAGNYATHTAADLAPKATAHINATLPVTETRSVPQIRSANDAAIQTAQQPMTTGVAPEEGGEAVHAELNAAHDVSRKVHEDAWAIVDKAHPESAVVADTQRAPVVTAVMSEASPFLGEDWSSTRKLLDKLDSLKQGAVPKTGRPVLPDLPPAAQSMIDRQEARDPIDAVKYEAVIRKQLGLDKPLPQTASSADLADVRPLTVRRLRDLDRWMGSEVHRLGSDNPEAIQFIVSQNALRDQLSRLSEEGHIEGDPNVVDALHTAIDAYANHRQTFGSGLTSDLTARNNRTEDLPVIPAYGASEHIFGTGENVKPLTKLVPDLEDIRRVVTPDAFGKLQAEAAARHSPQDLLDYAQAHPTAAETIFSPDSRTAAQGAAEGAQNGAASNAALDTGAGVLKTPTVDFEAALGAHAPEHVPHAQTAARQALLNKVQSGSLPDYGEGDMGTANLGSLFGSDAASNYGSGLSAISDQAKNATDLAKTLEQGASNSKNFVDMLAGRHIDTLHGAVRRGLAERYNKTIGTKLTPDEGDAVINHLISDADISVPILQDLMRRSRKATLSPEAESLIAPLVSKGLDTSQDASPTAMDDLRRRYGLDLPVMADVGG